MRVSPSDLRSGISDAAYRIPSTRPAMTNPHAMITKAVRLFHTEGDAAAVEYLVDGFAKPTWQKGANATKARIARQNFDKYRARAAADPRTVALGDNRATIPIGEHTVAAGCDIVLMDGPGYVGRLCIWAVQTRPLTATELALLACPVVLALGNELGDDLIHGIDIWALRADTASHISADVARGQTANLNTLVSRITG